MPRTKVNEKTFEGQSMYVGIDCHLKSWKVTILGDHYVHKTMSCNPSPEQLADYLKKNFPGAQYKAVYEAGFSGFGACRKLNKLGVECMVIHAADVPTSQKDRLQKTDKADSKKLGRMLQGGQIDGIHIPEEALEADRALCRQRETLVKDLSRNKNRVKSLLLQFGIEIPERFTQAQTRSWSKVFMDWLLELPGVGETIREVIAIFVETGRALKKSILKVNQKIRALSKSPCYKEKFGLLVRIPGVGLVTAMNILTQLGDIERFKRLDELCNYVGLVPNMQGSGEKMVTGKMTRRGRKKIKILLIEAAWIAVRKDPALMARFNELSKRMNKNKAIIRIAKNLLSRIRHVLRHGVEYEPGVVN